jgi:hypothetical protein
MPNPTCPLHAILPDSINVKDPRSFFNIFLRFEDLELIVASTNKYVKVYTK